MPGAEVLRMQLHRPFLSLTFAGLSLAACGGEPSRPPRTNSQTPADGGMMPPADGAMMMPADGALPPPPDGAMPPPPDGALPPPPDGAMPPPPDGAMPPPPDGGMPPPDGAMPPADGGMMMGRACTMASDCTAMSACPMDARMGCTCATTPGGRVCVPSCMQDTDCPTPPMGALRCEQAMRICVPGA